MATDAPPLSRRRLLRILGLEADAPASEMTRAAHALLDHLEARLAAAEPGEANGLAGEIRCLRESLEHWGGSDPARELARRRGLRAVPVLLVLLALATGYAAGYRVVRPEPSEGLPGPSTEDGMAVLRISSRPPGGMLRIRPEGEEDLRVVAPATGEPIELTPGRYDFEVAREDCPDRWERTIQLAPGDARRLEATVCLGRGDVVVRSNVSNDRLRIDGLDVGGTGRRPHSLRTGDHALRVDKPGYTPFEGRVRITPGGTVEVRAELQPFSGSSAAGRPPSPERQSGADAPARRPSAPPSEQGGPGIAARPAPAGGTAASPLPNRFLPRDEVTGEKVVKGGSTTWHDGVTEHLLGRFDFDGSGRIDRLEEAEAVPCALWLEIERSFDQGGLGLSMAHLYGFDGSEWHPGALGFAREMRAAAYEKMKECGLAP